MSVCIHGISSCYGNIVKKTKAMAARWVIGTGHHPCGACMVSWGADGTEGVAYLKSDRS